MGVGEAVSGDKSFERLLQNRVSEALFIVKVIPLLQEK